VPRFHLALNLINDVNDYQRSIRIDAMEAAARFGYSLETHCANGDVAEQIRQLYLSVNRPADQRPSAVMLFPVRDGSFEYVLRDVARAGINVVLLNRRPEYLATLRGEFPGVALGTVGPDQVEGGRIQGRQARALLPQGGFVLYVMGPFLASATKDRRAGFLDVLSGAGIDHAQVHGDWSDTAAEHSVGQWLRLVMLSSIRLDLVVCQNDAMAVGARRALVQAARTMSRPKLATVRLLGFDGHPDVGQRLVASGELTATVIQKVTGKPAVEWIAGRASGQALPLDVVLPLTAFPDASQLARSTAGSATVSV
jgi:ABC-type sugar transport system substrate-binding protein